MALVSGTIFATITGNGYYRVQNYGSNRWVSMVDNTGSADLMAGTADLHALSLINDNNNYITCSSETISNILRNTLQQWLDYTPKATGAGTFVFSSGAILPQDSLWFIQNGWKIKSWSR